MVSSQASDAPGGVGRPRAGRATIKEVAQLAGVSHQTVSRYLRFDGDGIRPAFRERIRTAISELGYKPSLAARAMRTKRTGQVAVLLPEGSAHSSVEILNGARETARAAGYQLDVLTLGGDIGSRTQRAVELLQSNLFEGVLSLTPLRLGDAGLVEAPMVVELGLYAEEMHAIGVLADGSSITEIISGLAERGHRTFMHVAGDYAWESARNRRRVYEEAIEELGLASFGVVDCDWMPDKARRAIVQLPPEAGVTAVVAANDRLAAGVVRGAMERGWDIPGDLSVTGFDEQELSRWFTPALSSVAVDHEELGRRALGQLVASLRGEDQPRSNSSVFTVNWRDSVGVGPATGSRDPLG